MRFGRLSILLIFCLGIHCDVIDERTHIRPYEQIADELVRSALSDEIGYSLLAELAAIGPRLAGSENSEEAVLWAKGKMEEIGLDRVRLLQQVFARVDHVPGKLVEQVDHLGGLCRREFGVLVEIAQRQVRLGNAAAVEFALDGVEQRVVLVGRSCRWRGACRR